MSAREIIAVLPGLTVGELRALERRIAELTSLGSSDVLDSDADGELRAERVGGRLVLAGQRTIRQAEVEAILDEFS